MSFPGDDKKKFFLWWRIQKGRKLVADTHYRKEGKLIFQIRRICPFWCERWYWDYSIRTFDSFYSLCCFGIESDLRTFHPQLFVLELIRMSQLSSASLRHCRHIGWHQTCWCHSQLDEVIFQDSCWNSCNFNLRWRWRFIATRLCHVQHAEPWN